MSSSRAAALRFRMWLCAGPCPPKSATACCSGLVAWRARWKRHDYLAKLRTAGFEAASTEPTREYNVEDARQFLTEAGVDVDAIAPQVEGKFMSAFIRATKPTAACCAAGLLHPSHDRSNRISDGQTTTTSCFSAPAIRRGRSWPRRSSTTKAKGNSPRTVPAAILSGQPRPEALRQIESARLSNRGPAQ